MCIYWGAAGSSSIKMAYDNNYSVHNDDLKGRLKNSDYVASRDRI